MSGRNFTDQVGYAPDETFGWALFLGLMIVVGGAVGLASSDRATASPQPALVNHAASGVDGPAGFDQAQGGRQ